MRGSVCVRGACHAVYCVCVCVGLWGCTSLSADMDALRVALQWWIEVLTTPPSHALQLVMETGFACVLCTFVNEAGSVCGMCGAAADGTGAAPIVAVLPDEPAAVIADAVSVRVDADAMLALQLQQKFDHEAEGAEAAAKKKKLLKALAEEQAASAAVPVSSYVRKFAEMRSTNPSPEAMKRITSDLKEALRAKNGMFVVRGVVWTANEKLPVSLNAALWRLPSRRYSHIARTLHILKRCCLVPVTRRTQTGFSILRFVSCQLPPPHVLRFCVRA